MDSHQKPQAGKTAARSLTWVISTGMLLGALFLQWSSISAEQARQREEKLFAGNTCKDAFPPPWRTQRMGHSAELLPSIRQFGLPSCESIEFRPSRCNDDHFLVRCYEETERKGLWRVYRVELEKEEIYSVFPDVT